jgi:amino acid permease
MYTLKVCKMSGGTSYRGIWTATMGTKGSLAVAVANTLLPCLGNLAYSTSQSAVSLCLSIGIVWSRVTCLFMVTIFLLLPLCLLKNLHVLAPFSVLGTGAVVLTAIAMVIRFWDGSYQPGGVYYDDIEPRYQPSFGRSSRPWSPSALPFLCMVFESFVMHYNVPRYSFRDDWKSEHFVKGRKTMLTQFHAPVACIAPISCIVGFTMNCNEPVFDAFRSRLAFRLGSPRYYTL